MARVSIHIYGTHTSHRNTCRHMATYGITHTCMYPCAPSKEMTHRCMPAFPLFSHSWYTPCLSSAYSHACVHVMCVTYLVCADSLIPMRMQPHILGLAHYTRCILYLVCADLFTCLLGLMYTFALMYMPTPCLDLSAVSGGGGCSFPFPTFIKQYFLSKYYIPGCVLDAGNRG